MGDMKNEMLNVPHGSLDGFVGEIKQIIDSARANAVRSVDFCRVQMYWNIGKRIFEKEQQGKERADYARTLSRTSRSALRPTMAAGFQCDNLKCAVSFTALTRLRIQCVRN